MTTYDLDTPYTVSGSRWSLCYDPDADRVYTFTGVGAGSPEPVFHGRHPSWNLPVNAVFEDVAGWVRDNLALFPPTAPADDPEGEAYDAVRDALERATEPGGAIGQYWDAGDWFAGDPGAVVESALAHDSIEAAAETEVETALGQGVHILQEDAEEELTALLKYRVSDMEGDDLDEKGAKRLAKMRALLGIEEAEEDDEPEPDEQRAEDLFRLERTGRTHADADGVWVEVGDGEARFWVDAQGLDEELPVVPPGDEMAEAYAAWCRDWIRPDSFGPVPEEDDAE